LDIILGRASFNDIKKNRQQITNNKRQTANNKIRTSSNIAVKADNESLLNRIHVQKNRCHLLYHHRSEFCDLQTL